MLERTAAASAEMPAWRYGTARARNNPLGDPAFAPRSASRAEPGAHAIAGYRVGQKHRFSRVERNAIALSAEPLDRQLDELLALYQAGD